MSCICNKMNLTLNSHGSPNVAGADAALTALWFAHGLGNGISASQGLQQMSGGDSGRHYVRRAETIRRAWQSGHAKTLIAVRAQAVWGTLLTVSLEQLCRTDA